MSDAHGGGLGLHKGGEEEARCACHEEARPGDDRETWRRRRGAGVRRERLRRGGGDMRVRRMG
jgi:hypothetical protein